MRDSGLGFAAGRDVELDRQHFGDRRAGPTAFGEGAAAAEHQQAAAALVHEVGEHPELLGREGRRFDAAEDDRAIGKQLFAGLGKSADQLLGTADAQPQVLVLRRSLQHGHEEIGVVLDGAPQKFHFEARLALHVKHALLPVEDLDEGIARVVLGHLLAALRLDLELEESRAGIGGGEADANDRRLAVWRQRHILGAQDSSLVLHAQRDGLPAVPGLRDDDVDRERRTFERRPGRFHPRDLDVVREVLLADTDRKHRDGARFQARQRLVEAHVRRVGAVGHHDEPRERQPRELVARPVEGLPQMGRRAAVLEVRGARQAIGGRREAEEPQHEALRQRVEERTVGLSELVLHEIGTRLVVAIRDGHAAGVVDDHAEEVLLRHRGF